jgi:phenylacetate-CoA ligase
LRERQFGQLRELLQGVLPSNAFYRAKLGLGAAGLHSLDDFARLPFTTKHDLAADQQAHPPYGTNLTYPLEQYTRYHQTSGTTGGPIRWLDTGASWAWMRGLWLEVFRAADVGPADRIVFAFSFGPFLGFWLAFEAGTKLGALCLPAGGLSSLARLRMILDCRATVLCCTPTYALRLALVAAEEKLDLSQTAVRRIIVAGEPGGSIPATRSRLESFWPGARVFDHHGMTETGPVSFECPRRPGFLHIMEQGFYAEILDAQTGSPVSPGEPGELVLTNFGRTGSPLIRYRTGDLVRQDLLSAESGCPCGRPDLALEGGILGRVDDMFIVRGVNVYPSAVEQVLRAFGEIAEYQVRVNRAGAQMELQLVIEPAPSCPDVARLISAIEKRLQEAFALRVPVQSAPAGTLPRFEMKAKRWVLE